MNVDSELHEAFLNSEWKNLTPTQKRVIVDCVDHMNANDNRVDFLHHPPAQTAQNLERRGYLTWAGHRWYVKANAVELVEYVRAQGWITMWHSLVLSKNHQVVSILKTRDNELARSLVEQGWKRIGGEIFKYYAGQLEKPESPVLSLED